MPPQNQDTAAPAPGGDTNPPKPQSGVDLSKILLPKKEGAPSVDSAQRISAGALLAQEQKAGSEGLPAPAKPPTPAPAPAAPAKEESSVGSLQTYKGDIERVVEGGASVVSIAAAEARRKDDQSKQIPAPAAAPVSGEHRLWVTVGMLVGGVLLIALSAGIVAYFLTRPTSVEVAQAPTAPFIAVDDSALVSVPPDAARAALMQALQDARKKVSLSLGLVEWLYVARPAATAGGAPQALSAQELLSTLSGDIPDTLLRSLKPTYLLGVHSFDENQAFLILQVDSYETGYAGMLGWERSMQDDLAPLFTRTPSPTIQNAPAPIATTTATSTASTSPQAAPLPDSGLFQTGFADKVVENHDARVILDPQGDILLLWTFLGRNTVVITTNEYTLREVVSRMQNAPVVPVAPGQ